jgi:hypothetical protein
MTAPLGAAKYIVDDQSNNHIATSAITPTGFTDDITLKRIVNGRQASRLIATTKTGLVLAFDFQSAKSVGVFAILNHNFTSAATIKIQADDDPAFGSLDVDVTLTWNRGQIIYVWSTDQTYRYWRLTIEDAGNLKNPAIGELILGLLTAFTKQHDWRDSERFLFGNRNTEDNVYGNMRSYHLFEQRTYENMNFTKMSDNEIEEVEAMLEATQGSAKPILFINGIDVPNDAIYGHMVDNYGRRFQFTEWNDIPGIAVREQPRPNHLRVIS